MAKHLPAQTPPVRVIHYVDPATRTDLTNLPPAELLLALSQAAARRRDEAVDRRARYAAWLARQDEIRRHDRKLRRVLLAAVPGAFVLLAAGGWVLAQITVAAVSTAAVVGGVAVAVVVALAVGAVGRRCVTVVQHWHE